MLISGGALGLSYGQDMQRRHKELWALKRSISIAVGDLEYGGVSLHDIFCHIKRQSIEAHIDFWDYLIRASKGETRVLFQTIWQSAIEEQLAESCLQEKDKSELMTLGLILGNGDKKQQVRGLILYQNSLEKLLFDLENEKANKLKLCHSLGVIGSIFLVVLLC